MRNPWWPEPGLGGVGEFGGVAGLGRDAVRSIPSAEAVAVVAQRMSGIAQEMEVLRRQMAGLEATDWHSAAATAFRQSLSACSMALAGAVRKVESAAASVGSYGTFLQSSPASSVQGEPCAAPNAQWPQGAGSGTQFGPRFSQGFGPDWGAGF
ncbi:hypothetical protein [Arthrobacter sp. E3]|uniref:hypothetical protein n=1 Tax=Arthrobacter sp. E3 TaxID=517402 RepID=UPI001A94FD23|nr:hypothetical protein [Arthrobacter sp. E3]